MPTSSSSAQPEPRDMDAQVPRYAVFGQPVAHSLSPRIHAAFAAQTGILLQYGAIESGAEQLPQRLARFIADGGRGANLTLPLKEAVLPLCSRLDPQARLAGAVNTLLLAADGWHGHNTDGIGLVRDLTQRHGVALERRGALILGAGGAARGVLPALLDAGLGEVIVSNRTHARAQALQHAWHDEPRLRIRPWPDLDRLGTFDILIDATSAGRGSDAVAELPNSLIGNATVAVSLNYGAASHAFLHWASMLGATTCVDGLGMLVEQAAESFRLWHGLLPQTNPVYRQLRAD